MAPTKYSQERLEFLDATIDAGETDSVVINLLGKVDCV